MKVSKETRIPADINFLIEIKATFKRSFRNTVLFTSELVTKLKYTLSH